MRKEKKREKEENNILLNQHSVYIYIYIPYTGERGVGGMGSSLHVHTIIEECPASRSSSFFFLLLLFFQLVVDVDQFISDERPPSCHVHRFAFEKIGMPAIPITDGLNVLTSLSILPQWKYIPLVYRYQH
jgi:hypothetical protein